MFAATPESAAAPTAGLHLTNELLARCNARGIETAFVDLAVGLDTFRPMSADKVEHHVMHGERYVVPPETWQRCAEARSVVAVGTTVVRALESAAATGELEGRTELFIHGDYDFKVVDRLLTNFHLPRSSLLVMIDAFVGPRWRDLYEQALQDRDYRFLSFGDAMLLQGSVSEPAGSDYRSRAECPESADTSIAMVQGGGSRFDEGSGGCRSDDRLPGFMLVVPLGAASGAKARDPCE